jgi:hypothetical protein
MTETGEDDAHGSQGEPELTASDGDEAEVGTPPGVPDVTETSPETATVHNSVGEEQAFAGVDHDEAGETGVEEKPLEALPDELGLHDPQGALKASDDEPKQSRPLKKRLKNRSPTKRIA